MVRKSKIFAEVLMVSFALVLAVSFVSAAFSVGEPDSSINTVYGPSENIQGWVNLSFSNANSDSLFEDSEGNSISLMGLLDKGSYQYSCQPTDCSEDYSASNGSTSKSFDLAAGNSKFIGLKFTGNILGVDSASFTLQSNAGASCSNQLKLDVLDDGEVDFINNKVAVGAGCTSLRDYGCYDSSESNQEYKISGTPYCNKINLTESPAFTVGAWIKKVSGSGTMEATIYDKEGFAVGNCNLPDASSSGGEVSCDINYPVTKPDSYFVCISSAGGTGDYRIRGNPSPTKGCGFWGLPPPKTATNSAYQIFAQGKRFGTIGTLQVTNNFPDGSSFAAMIEDYISERYGGFDCSSGCTVPIKITSGANQQITLSGLSVEYQNNQGILTENNFYDLNKIPAKITSNFQKIYLDEAGFSVPNELGSYDFSLDFDNKEIVSQTVDVKDVPLATSLTPLSTASSYPTTFKVTYTSPNNVSKFFWDFGDGSQPLVTLVPEAMHTYSALGNYTITVTISDVEDFSSSKKFDIKVNSPKSLIGSTIINLKNNIDSVESGISTFDSFTQDSINTALDTDNVTQEVNLLDQSFSNANTEEEYNQIISELVSLKYPTIILEGSVAQGITFFPTQEDINPEALSDTGSYDSSNEEKYAYAISIWNNENLDSRITYQEYLGNYDSSLDVVTRIFDMSFSEKQDILDNYYLVLPKLENLKFEPGVTVNDAGSYVYVDITGRRSISFSTTSNVDFTNLPAFVSPGLNSLSLENLNISPAIDQRKSKLTVLILALSILGIVAFFVYIVLQQWYKRKYENYLFKNRNDLYNIVNYINSAKKRGLKNKEIEQNLRKAKWSGEQITYVMKKYAGKRTGMLEIPIDKVVGALGSKNKGRK